MIFHRFSIVACLLLVSGCTSLGVLNAVMPKDDNTLKVVEGIAYGDNARQKLDVYVPESDDSGPLPVVMFIYGGSWKDGRRQDYEFVGRALNGSGYIAVLPDYQLVPDVRFPEFVLDGARALQWVYENIASYGGDPDTLFLAGHSAGAYNAVMVALGDELLAENGLTAPTIKGFAGIAGPYDFLPLQSRPTRDAFGQVEDLESTQPINLIKSDAPPLLLLHGDDDDLVWTRNSRSLHDAANQAGADSTLIEYPGIGHVRILLSLGKSLRGDPPTYADMISFFDRIKASPE